MKTNFATITQCDLKFQQAPQAHIVPAGSLLIAYGPDGEDWWTSVLKFDGRYCLSDMRRIFETPSLTNQTTAGCFSADHEFLDIKLVSVPATLMCGTSVRASDWLIKTGTCWSLYDIHTSSGLPRHATATVDDATASYLTGESPINPHAEGFAPDRWFDGPEGVVMIHKPGPGTLDPKWFGKVVDASSNRISSGAVFAKTAVSSAYVERGESLLKTSDDHLFAVPDKLLQYLPIEIYEGSVED